MGGGRLKVRMGTRQVLSHLCHVSVGMCPIFHVHVGCSLALAEFPSGSCLLGCI